VAKRPPAIPDEAWQLIVKAAAPHKHDEHARAALDDCIWTYSVTVKDAFDLRQLKYDRDLWRKAATQGREHLRALYKIKRRTLRTVPDPERPQRDIDAVKSVLGHTETDLKKLEKELRAHQRRQDPAREFRWRGLCAVWTNHFAGELGTSVARHRPPYGPVVRFITAVFEHALNEPISPHTIRDAVRREQTRRRLQTDNGVLPPSNSD
jgi:hypothetical protein